MDWYSESARLLHLGHIAKTCLWRKAWAAFKFQRSSKCYRRQMAWCWSSDNEKSCFVVEKAFSSSGKTEWRTYSAHFLHIFSDDLAFWHSVRIRATTWMMNPLQNVLWHVTLFRSSRLIHKCFRRKFLDLFGDVCLFTEYVLFSSFILITLLHSVVRKFGTFFPPPRILFRVSCLSRPKVSSRVIDSFRFC